MNKLRKAIAIDFDGCICTNEWPNVGIPDWDIINAAKKEKVNGAGLILWTCRVGEPLEKAIQACKTWGLEFDTINESLPDWIEDWGNAPRKVAADEYWDDLAIRKVALQGGKNESNT